MKYEDIKKLGDVKKWVSEKINESILRLFDHVERMDRSWFFKRL